MLRRSGISFEKDESSRFLPWIITFMVFLAGLAVAGIFLLNDITNHFGAGVQDTMTVQIPVTEKPETDDLRVAESLRLIQNIDGVIAAKPVKPEEISELLRPWLGLAAQNQELPLPRVIDVHVDRSSAITDRQIFDTLAPVIPVVVLDDHCALLQTLVRALNSTELIAAGIMLFIGLATMGTVVFTTRTGMGLQQETISVLHFVGAKDSYIARQFALRALWLGIKGGFFGVILTLPVLFLLRLALGRLGSGLLPELSLPLSGWISLGALIPAVAIIAMVTARFTVSRSLAKML